MLEKFFAEPLSLLVSIPPGWEYQEGGSLRFPLQMLMPHRLLWEGGLCIRQVVFGSGAYSQIVASGIASSALSNLGTSQWTNSLSDPVLVCFSHPLNAFKACFISLQNS
jgi:hypothetical protein